MPLKVFGLSVNLYSNLWGLLTAELVRKSATTQAAPVIARFCALPAQLNSLWASAKSVGNHTSSAKPTSINVSNREARRAACPESKAMAASAKATVVVIAQNICPGGIHLGTNEAVAER